MRYLLFADPGKDYGAEKEIVLAGSRRRAFGAYEDKDAGILLSLHDDCKETTADAYDVLKKKLGTAQVSYRLLKTVQQDPSRDPNAVYVDEETVAQSDAPPVEELISVGEAEVEDPLEDTD